MGKPYPVKPVQVQTIATEHRTITTPIPHPDSLPLLEQLRRSEPVCMEGQPPIVWDRAYGATIHDAYGNRWIDFTSGVLITNAGHGRRTMVDAVARTAQQQLLTTYCFPNRARAELTDRLQRCAPRPDDKVMLLSTGSEAIELTIKLCRRLGRERPGRNVFVTFDNAFHGRTLASQLAGGIPDLKQWIGYDDEHYVQVPFPDGVRCEPRDMTFDAFERRLRDLGVQPAAVCGVLSETYQGGNSSFAPSAYMQALRSWCDRHDVVLVLDEVQAGFGRTGRFWGFEHYGILPDLIACGKGISGSLPLSAVIGRHDLMDMFPPGSMTSTHSGNPICCAAALESLKLIQDEDLVDRAATLGQVMQDMAHHIQERFSHRILAHHGRGMVASLHCVKSKSREPDDDLAWRVIGEGVRQGVMLFAPVGYGGASVKLSPPLVIEEQALREGMQVIGEVFAQVLEGEGA